MTSRAARPSFLNSTASHTEKDRPLERHEIGRVWAHYEPYVRTLVVRALRRVSLHRAEALASVRGDHAALVADVTAVRRSLQDAADDHTQDVGVKLLEAVDRGGVRASHACLKSWFDTTTYRVVRREVVEAAVLRFAAGTPHPDHGDLPEAEPVDHRDPETLAATRAMRARLPMLLNRKQLAVVEGKLAGEDHAAIAEALGLTETSSRRLLSQALKVLVADARAGTPVDSRS